MTALQGEDGKDKVEKFTSATRLDGGGSLSRWGDGWESSSATGTCARHWVAPHSRVALPFLAGSVKGAPDPFRIRSLEVDWKTGEAGMSIQLF